MMQKKSAGLRTHATVLSLCLVTLTGVLGTRAYSIARQHARETNNLVNYDVHAQALLVQLMTLAAEKDHTARKFKITRDPVYGELLAVHQSNFTASITELTDTLSPIYPDLADKAAQIQTQRQVSQIRQVMEKRREKKLQEADQAAAGILRLILFSMVLSLVLTAWVVYFFSSGLVVPMRRLRLATAKIAGGDLSYRIHGTPGITEIRELSASFNSMAERLEALEKSKAEFLANISHEIKNPLAALKEGLNLIAVQGENLSPQSRSKASQACLIAAKRLESMINNLLGLSKGEMDLFHREVAIRDLTAAIQTAIDEVRVLAEKKGMTIHFERTAEILVPFNWEGMVHVFENLLGNAVKYGEEKSHIDVEAKLSDDRSQIHLSVKNSGAGIAPTEISRIFDRFYRASNSGSQRGLGIGLHVVKKIIEAHRGDIFAESEESATRIRFWLPTDSQPQYLSGGTI